MPGPAKPCARCIIIDTDQSKGIREKSPGPLSALNAFRKTQEGKLLFGENLIHEINDRAFPLCIGDEVEVLEWRDRDKQPKLR